MGQSTPLASPMATIGVPTEIKRDEQRAALQECDAALKDIVKEKTRLVRACVVRACVRVRVRKFLLAWRAAVVQNGT